MATPIPDNSARLRVAEIVGATGGVARELQSDAELVGVSTDSRTVPDGALFVALRGAEHDGHDFADAARLRGAVPLVAAGAGLTGPLIEVDDPLVALGRLARFHVDRLAAATGGPPLLAIGGAAGKTTTKELAAAVVETLFGDTLVTAGNLNNRIGVPMTLLALERRHRAIVLECATSERGEIAALAQIARPDVALVVNVGIEHSAGLGTLEEIADEEAGLLHAARSTAMTLADEPLLTARLAAVGAPRRLTFGTSGEADVRLAGRRVLPGGGSELVLELGDRLLGERPRRLAARTSLLGPAAALNFAAALGAALALRGRPPSAGELETAIHALSQVGPPPGRMCPRPAGEILVLDDTYNSNPQSLGAALATAGEIAASRDGRLLVALGDMLELGELSAAAHDEMLRAAERRRPGLLFLIGEEWRAATERRAPEPPHLEFATSNEAAAEVVARARPGDLLLVKGSRGMRMERIVDAVLAAAPPFG